MVNEADLKNLNNEQTLQYIKRLQPTLEQYKAREEASFMTHRIREEVSIDILRTRTKAIQTQFKEKAKLVKEESSNEALKDVGWKLIRAVQRYQKEHDGCRSH